MTLKIYESGVKAAPTILFLHGMGVSSWMWQDQIEALSQDYHCLAVDLPGNGESYEVEWVSLADTADQLASIIQEKATDGKAHVVGLSLGGYTAVTLLAHHPELVASLIVSGVTTRPFPRQWFYRPLMAALIPTMKWDTMINLNMKMMQMPAEVAPLYRRDSKRVPKVALQRVYDEVFNFTLPRPLSEINVPVLAVAGDKEAKLVQAGLSDFPQQLPNSVAALVPQAHHGWNGEYPDLFTEMVKCWVAKRPLPERLKIVSGARKTLLSER
jgi:pimeloyl-ACP methyl ester carboxylesterase